MTYRIAQFPITLDDLVSYS